tara:strand:- start:799 stop:1233 length:435 start_codon:yes stop_codon:yes gene_type:complete
MRYSPKFLPLPVMSSLSSLGQKHSDVLYFLFRALVGFMFMSHGMQKVGLLEGTFAAEGLMGFIGVCELLGGLAVMVGFFTRLASLLAAILMILAYFKMHASQGLLPLNNGGEPALLYAVSFLVIFVHGAQKWSLEKSLLKRETF